MCAKPTFEPIQTLVMRTFGATANRCSAPRAAGTRRHGKPTRGILPPFDVRK
ncbi:hypothetical protein COLSTE_01332 [Collinsella stercoris DSM 13279]|uniref:Uncharacterized protein n=1 Tax=Collinsella stercoris DSM 13279 TaxID=445975 RepID=B6GB74_9ACTN|nr:hypothetical protein COLSTE_01332 [Collinsella stercoris DSM 13279]